MKNKLLHLFSLGFTAYGVFLLVTGDLTNGLLSMILGELIDIEKTRLGNLKGGK